MTIRTNMRWCVLGGLLAAILLMSLPAQADDEAKKRRELFGPVTGTGVELESQRPDRRTEDGLRLREGAGNTTILDMDDPFHLFEAVIEAAATDVKRAREDRDNLVPEDATKTPVVMPTSTSQDAGAGRVVSATTTATTTGEGGWSRQELAIVAGIILLVLGVIAWRIVVAVRNPFA